ncbi:MAG: tetratricopeptide repeat protein [Gammaproteobacteria bacterium]|nr:tetratricopeptide repeat protein [Gammaproteobacteria bacterium]
MSLIKNFYGELRRRNVVKVATVYLIAGWLAIQIIDVAFPLLQIPEWAGALVLILVLIGFPFALIFAWAFELTPEGLKREADIDRSQSITPETGRRIDFIIIGLLLIAVVYFFLEPRISTDRPVTAEVTQPVSEAAPSQSSDISVAVLPFINMSSDKENEYFSDGISEELLNVLVKIKGLRVPSRTSSFAFRNQKMNIAEIARALGVDHILEGSVRKAGGRVRITAQLIDVDTDTHLWSESFDRDLDDIFAVQDEIAQKIVRAIQETLSVRDVGDAAAAVADNRPPSGSVEAYELYLQGRHLLYRRGDHLEKALARFKEVVQADPEYAAAWSGLAATYIVYPDYLPMDRQKARIDAREAAETSLELRPDQAESLAVLGLAAADDYRWTDSMAYFDRAIAQNPGEPTAYLWKGIQLLKIGYPDRAEHDLRKAVELAPGTGVNRSWLAVALMLNGDVEEAERYAILAQDLGHFHSTLVLAEIYEMRGDIESAAEAMDRWHRAMRIEPFRPASLAYAARGNDQLESEVIDWALNAKANFGPGVAVGPLAILRSPKALDLMRTMFANVPAMVSILWFPRYAYVRAMPGTAALLQDLKLHDYWLENGWPRWCRPSGESMVCE